MSRITGTLGKGIATLTLDEEYQKKRREALSKRPADLKEGLARGGKGLVMVRGCFVIEDALKISLVYFFFLSVTVPQFRCISILL